MKNKIFLLMLVLSFALFLAMGYMNFTLQHKHIGSLFAAIPKTAGQTISLDALEEINQDKILLSYEIPTAKTIDALQSHYDITLKATNHTYPYVVGYSILYGGFFAEEAFDNQNKVAILNKKAAFDIYGTINAVGNEFKMDRQPYVVIGVLDDQDEENLNIWIPATCLAEFPQTVMAKTESGTVSEELVINEYKRIGVTDLKYNFINLGAIVKLISQKMQTSALIAGFGFLLLFIKSMILRMFLLYQEIAEKQKHVYLGELVKDRSLILQKLIFYLMVTIGTVVMELYISLSIVKNLLQWQTLIDSWKDITYTSFLTTFTTIQTYDQLTTVLFFCFIGLFTICFLALLLNSPKDKDL